MRRRAFAVSALLTHAMLAAPAVVAPAWADDWPSRQIKLVIPYPPGGPTDISTRIVMEKAGHILRQPILFDNKAGASGMIGAEYAKGQAPDGYTFLATTVAMLTITRHLQPIPFDPEKDFLTVAHVDLVGGARHQPLGAGQHHGRVRGLRESQPGQGQFRFRRACHHHPSLWRDSEPRGRHQDGARALQGQRPGDAGPAGRPDPGAVRPDDAALHPGRQAQGAGNHLRLALAAE